MRRNPGEPIGSLQLPCIDGTDFDLDGLRGRRLMLSFFRFAACPFCNLRVHELASRYGELGGRCSIVAVFDSPLDNLQRQAGRHGAPFPVLADEGNRYYRAFGIERSVFGVLKAAFVRFPSVLDATLRRGFLPTSFHGHLATLPADFLADEEGVIREAYYGRDIGDHLPFERVKAFARAARP